MDWNMNDVMPGSDGLRIWGFWKTVSWRQDAELTASGRLRALGPQRPTVEQPSQDEKEVLLGQYSSLSSSPAHLSHTTNINPFEYKVWEVYFYKEMCSFVHWSSSLLLTMFPLIFVLCIRMLLYNISSFFCTQSNGSKYCYKSLKIKLNISYMTKHFYF